MNSRKKIDFMIVGAEKAGTTSLLRYLEQQPNLCVHKTLEMTYFVRDDEYLAGYDAAYEKYFTSFAEGQKILAKNVGCMYFPHAAQRMNAHNPSMKLIVILRNPIERAYSAYWYARQMGRESLQTFEEAIEKEEQRKNFGSEHEKRFNMYLDRGLYAKQISVLLCSFPREQLKVILFEELKNNPKKVVVEVTDFLKIDNFQAEISESHNTAGVPRSEFLAKLIGGNGVLLRLVSSLIPNQTKQLLKKVLRSKNKKNQKPPKLNENTRVFLRDFYKEEMKNLGRILDLDFSHWK